MSPREEEEFELVLGNKQLLSLFFLVVVLFGVFFSFGYTVGYSRGEGSQTRDVASAEPVEEPSKKVQLPEALLQDAPKPTTPSLPTKTEPTLSAAAQKNSPPPSAAKTAPNSEASKPRPVQEAPKPVEPPPTKTSAPPKTAPPKTSALPKTSAPPKTAPATNSSVPAKTSTPAPQPSAQAVATATHLQVSAVRVKKDADVYVEQLRAKGHPATVSDQGDGWYRVVVGPFKSTDEAEAYQKRLLAEGVKSLLRKH
jgi:cell division protein FtsN